MMINAQFKVLDEAEYMDDIIEERGKNIAQINNIMSDLKDMSSDFVVEVDWQGEKIDELGDNLDVAHVFQFRRSRLGTHFTPAQLAEHAKQGITVTGGCCCCLSK